MEKYGILENLIAFNTIGDKENVKIINYIEKVLKGLNFKTEYKDKCLIMSLGNSPKIGFLGHTDTVEYINEWNTCPFKLTKKGNRLYGLGVCDMKGGIAAMIDAISQIDLNKLKYGIKLYFTYDEEINFSGIKSLMKMNINFPELMLFGEPTNNKMLIGSKGLLEYELNFIGKKAHSSNPERGISANINAINFMRDLMDFYETNVKNYKESKYEVEYTTMNIGIINGGTAVNSIPASCNATLDFRIVNEKHIELLKNKIKELSKKYNCKTSILQEINPFINEISGIDLNKTANFITEASFIPKPKKIILGLGPVTAHEVNEYVTEKSYEKLVEEYKEIILKNCME